MPFLQILGFLGQKMQKGIDVISVPTVYEAASRPFVAALVSKKNSDFMYVITTNDHDGGNSTRSAVGYL
jgi:hypothetical protein